LYFGLHIKRASDFNQAIAMLFSTIIFYILSLSWVAEIRTLPTAGPTDVDSTYRDLYEYFVKRNGPDDPTANLIARHVSMTLRDWDDVYQEDVPGPAGSILTSDNTPKGRERAKRGYPSNSITAYTSTADCSGPYHYTFDNAQYNVCYPLIPLFPMFSLKVTDLPASSYLMMYIDRGTGCGGAGNGNGYYARAGEDGCFSLLGPEFWAFEIFDCDGGSCD
jgi:hypothetical protein